MLIEGTNDPARAQDDEAVVGWRMKDRYRFRNPDLVAIRYATECREVFDLHEAICDLIDEERQNRICVSLLTLATMIHDFPRAGEWETQRVAALEQLRERGLIEFQGVVTLADEIVISLPDRVWRRWHEGGKKHAANQRQRDPETGQFVPKEPAPTTNRPNGPARLPSGTPLDPSKTKPKAEPKTEGEQDAPTGAPLAGAHELPADPRTIAGQARRARGQLGDLAFYVQEVVSRRNADSRQPLTASTELRDFWRPACELLADHGRDRLKKALGVAATEQAGSMEFVRKVCLRLQRDDERSTKPRLAVVPNHGMSDDDLDALDAVEGADHVVR